MNGFDNELSCLRISVTSAEKFIRVEIERRFMKNAVWFSIALLACSMLSIQFGASVAKQLFPLAGVGGTTALRVSFSAILLFIVSRAWQARFSFKSLLPIAAYGMSLGLMNLLFYFSLERIPLGIAVALEFTGPLVVAVFSSRKAIDYIWVLLAALGIYLILPQADLEGALDPIGITYALAAGFFWALYILFGKSAGKLGGSLHVTSWGMVFAALVCLPAGLLVDGSEKVLNPQWIPMGILVAILSSALPYSLEMRALKNLPTKTFGILMSLEPAVATLMGFLFLKEYLTVQQGLAIACVILASLGSAVTARSAGK